MLQLALKAASIAVVFGGSAFAQEVNHPTAPAPPPPDRSAIILVPTLDGDAMGGASNSQGQGGLFFHQPHGGGYSTSGGALGDGSGTTFGGSVTTGPNGVEGGTINFGTTFE